MPMIKPPTNGEPLPAMRAGDTLQQPKPFVREAEITAFRAMEPNAEGGGGFVGEMDLSFSSEYEGMQYFGREVLVHTKEAVLLDRMNKGAGSVRWQHQRPYEVGEFLGRPLRAWLDEKAKVCRATVAFASTEAGRALWELVRTKQIVSVSAGYRIAKMELAEQEDGKPPLYRVVQWEPYEITFCDVPLDPNVGVGRTPQELPPIEIAGDAVTNNPTDPASGTVTSKESVERMEININAEREAAVKAERDRQTAIRALAKKHNLIDVGERACTEGTAIEAFREEVLIELEKRANNGAAPLINPNAPDIGLSKTEVKSYNLARAVLNLIDGNREGLEFEAHKAIADRVAKLGVKGHGGLFVPYEIQRANAGAAGTNAEEVLRALMVARQFPALQHIVSRVLNTGVPADGGAIVPTDYLGQSFIDLLRNEMVFFQLGAQRLEGLTGNVVIPRQTAGTVAAWVAEGAAAAYSQLAVGSLSLSPKTISANTEVTRQMLLQGVPSMNSLMLADIAIAVALGMDKAGFEGTGLANQPTGLFNTAGVPVIPVAAPAAITYDELINFVMKTKKNNARRADSRWAMSVEMEAMLRKTKIEAGQTDRAWATNDTVYGFGALSSNQITDSNIAFGDWRQMIVALWGILEIKANPYGDNAKAGNVELYAFQTADLGVRQPVGFAINKTMTPAAI